MMKCSTLALSELARLLEGAGDADLGAVRSHWPGIPGNMADIRHWLTDHPDIQQAVTAVDPEGPSPNATPLTLISADDILATDWPEPVWAVPKLLPTGLSILAGRPKIGKSWMALQIARGVGCGGQVLGEQVEEGPVLYLALEDPPRRLKDRMQAQRWPQGLPVEFMPLGQFTQQIDDLRKGGGERLAKQIQLKGYRLVVIDTLSRSVYGDQSDVQAMTLALTPVQEMAHEHSCAVLMVDHHRKGFGTDPDAVGDILGSTAKGAMADCVWGLYRQRGKAETKLQITGRDVVEQTLALRWDALTSCWRSEGSAYELELTQRRQEILDALRALGRAGVNDVAETVGQPKSNTHQRLQDLVNNSLVLRIQEGRRVWYELP